MFNMKWNTNNIKTSSWDTPKTWLIWMSEWVSWWKKNKQVKSFWWDWITNWKNWIKAWNLKIRQWIRFTSNSSSGNSNK